MMFGIPAKELKILKKLNSPKKIQDFLDSMPKNFEEKGCTVYAPMTVLKKSKCHCAEGAILAALALRVNGQEPLLLDLTATEDDYDHVVALYKKYGKWGAISKTNYAVLRFREPVYNSIRELAMSYFHEYLVDGGKKTLRSFSGPVNLKKFDKRGWMTTKEEIDYISEDLAKVKHYPIMNQKQIQNLRKADKIEVKAGMLVEWSRGRKQKNF
jgi:hypothetical protein